MTTSIREGEDADRHLDKRAQTRPARRRRSRDGKLSTPMARLLQLGIIGLWLLAWHITATTDLISPLLATSPIESWEYLVDATASGELISNTVATMQAVMISWVLAGTLGTVTGLALGLMPRMEQVLSPFLDALNAMPRIALAPLFLVAFGIGTTAKVALASTLVFFVALSGARAGVQSTDAEWLRMSTVLGASRVQIFTKIFFPVATPAIFASMRLGLIYAMLGTVASELIAARDGLGQLIALNANTYRIEAVYAILILLAVIASLLNQSMYQTERRLLRWQPPLDK